MISEHPKDIELLDALPQNKREEFERWLLALDAAHEKAGSPYGRGSLCRITGIACWEDFWQDGFSPEDALKEDLSNS